jgi:ATP-binding cassette, subfamily C (CFTR/MRP), member 1
MKIIILLISNKAQKDALATTTTHGSTLSSLMRAFGGSILFSAMLRLIADTLLITAPLVLGLIIRFIDRNEAMWKGYLLAFVLFLIQALQTYLMGQQYHYNFNTGYNIRGALMSAIYRKSLRLSSAAKRNTTVGEIVNLMAVDSNRKNINF